GLFLTDQLEPDRRHFHRIIARPGDQLRTHRVGFGLHRAAVFEQRQQGPELRQLYIVAEIDAGASPTDSGEHRADREDVGLSPLVAPRADLVPPQEMTRLVRDDSGELRLVAHTEEEAGKDHRETRRKHHRVEVGNPHPIDSKILRRRSADSADEVSQIACELWLGDEQIGVGNLLLDPRHVVPQALLIGVRWLEPRADEREHVGGTDPRLRHARMKDCRANAGPNQERPPAYVEAADAHQRLVSAWRTAAPGFILPRSRSTIWAAPSGVLRSPNLI